MMYGWNVWANAGWRAVNSCHHVQFTPVAALDAAMLEPRSRSDGAVQRCRRPQRDERGDRPDSHRGLPAPAQTRRSAVSHERQRGTMRAVGHGCVPQTSDAHVSSASCSHTNQADGPLPCGLRGLRLERPRVVRVVHVEQEDALGIHLRRHGAGRPFPSIRLPAVAAVPALAHLLPVGKRHEDVDRHDRLAVPAHHQLRHVPRAALRARRPRTSACRCARPSRSRPRPRS